MRQKRSKQYKRLMALYSTSFGFREPYQILVDGNFLYMALRYKMNICDQLCNVMLGKTKQMYTSCTLKEVRKQGKDWEETEMELQKFEQRRCEHRKKAVTSAECLSSIIEQDNPHNYCIATQNELLRESFRNVPGVPLLYINRSVLIVEPPSRATLEIVKKVEFEKTLAPRNEIKFLKKINSDTIIKGENEIIKKKRKSKGFKRPNPLSCKKKKAKPLPSFLTSQNNKNNNNNEDKISNKRKYEGEFNNEIKDSINNKETEIHSNKRKRKRKKTKAE
ncbi:hypothetical protein Glove_801g9 [Diversispora epigaea]|uniref:U three protein 23 n=1 Tax=Diversispora epigaea TaxID=1348612 RepID=A0A397G2X0_9GLOM|nr:hypothetical protein Glove_801g9 [Diversispora epigaea]